MNYFAHSTAVIDPGATIGDGTKIWHFSHIMSGAVIGPESSQVYLLRDHRLTKIPGNE